MQQIERDLFGNPIQPIQIDLTRVIQSESKKQDDCRTLSDDWRSRRDEEPERWDGLS